MGRPPKVNVEDRPQVLNRSNRPSRTSVNGKRDKLSLTGCEEGFHYCIVNDYNCDAYLEDDYEFVTHKIKIGDSHVNKPNADGERASVKVGNGVTGYVMRIPLEWYNDDRKKEQTEVSDFEDSMYHRLNSKEDGRYGEVKISQTKPLVEE